MSAAKAVEVLGSAHFPSEPFLSHTSLKHLRLESFNLRLIMPPHPSLSLPELALLGLLSFPSDFLTAFPLKRTSQLSKLIYPEEMIY